MGKGFRHGFGSGGSNPLNYKVVSGTILPANPTENMIWVNMTTAVNAVVFSATRPENPVHGTVWVKIGTSSPVAFNALKKETVMVYPVSVQRFVYGNNDTGEFPSWDAKEAKIYQNSVWHDLSGDDLADGVWAAKAMNHGSDYSAAPTIANNDDNIQFYVGQPSCYGVVYLEDMVDVSDFSTLTITGKFKPQSAENATYLALRLWSSMEGSNFATNTVAYKAIKSESYDTEITVSLDLTDVSGSYYIGLNMFTDFANSTFPIIMTRLVLER